MNGLLVLSRRLNESVKIGDEIAVTVVDIHGGQVKLAFSVPKHITVHRREIWNRIQREKM